MLKSTRRAAAALVFTAGVTLCTGFASAQSDEPSELLEEFIHYITVAKPDLAIGYGQELLDAGVSAADLAELVDSGDFDLARMDRAFERGLRVDGLEDIVAQVASTIEAGRLELARERDRIIEAIDMLGGTLRQRRLAERRLEAAGEYAVPYLLDAMLGGRSELEKQAIRDVLVGVGARAITPLSVALPNVDPVDQRSVIEMLEEVSGRGGRARAYRHAAPALAAIAQSDTTTEVVRELASGAFGRIYGADAALDDLYVELTGMYMSDLGSLVAYPFDPTNNVWSWESNGLVATPVPTVVFNEVMAMKSAATALGFDASNTDAIAAYVAADLRRENELPRGEVDPIFGDNDYSPEFYATVFGTGIAQQVLAYAIDTNDTPLVRDAISALSKTTGGSNLFPSDARRPLVEALEYTDRRARLDAALTLARAIPVDSFAGSGDVVPILASAIRNAGVLYAAVISDEAENARAEAARLEAMGYTVVATGGSAGEVLPAAGDVPALDLVLVRTASGDAAVQANADLRASRLARVSPVLIVAPASDVARLELEYRSDARTAATRPLDDSTFQVFHDALLDRAVGGKLGAGESEGYAIQAVTALKAIAQTGSEAYDIVGAESSLLAAFEVRSGAMRLEIADVLALMRSATAQRGLFSAALDASDERDQIDLLARVADSVKRFGNMSEDRHVRALVALVGSSTGPLADAAARVHGALNRPTGDAVGFISSGAR